MKQMMDLRVVENLALNAGTTLLTLESDTVLPEMAPGQFAEIKVEKTPGVWLRRPFGIHDVEGKRISFFIKTVGNGTKALAALTAGSSVNVILPLGKGFTIRPDEKVLLVGGGSGLAPLYFLAKRLYEGGTHPAVLLGARNRDELLRIADFQRLGTVYTTTDDGSEGIQGVVTAHPVLSETFDRVYICGPEVMMKAVARVAKTKECEVSLEHKMACGIGACLCCVTPTATGNRCVCSEGPVFNTRELLWQN